MNDFIDPDTDSIGDGFIDPDDIDSMRSERIIDEDSQPSKSGLPSVPDGVPYSDEVYQLRKDAGVSTDQPPGFWDSFKRSVPAMAGSIAAPLMAKTGGGKLLAAGLGGMVGNLATNAHEYMRGQEKTPMGVGKEAASEFLWSGAGELGGQAIDKGIDWLRIKPTPETLHARNLFLQNTAEEFTPTQMATGTKSENSYNMMESFTRSFVTAKGKFQAKDVSQLNSLNQFKEDIIDGMVGSTRNMTDEQVGDLFLNTVKGGRESHSVAAKQLYAALDNTPGVKPKVQRVQVTEYQPHPTLLDSAGRPIMVPSVRIENRVIDKGIQVDLGPIKEYAAGELDRLRDINNVGMSTAARKILSQLSGLPDEIGFGASQDLRSGILSLSREFGENLGKTKINRVANDIERMLSTQMEKTAKSAGGDVWDAYRKASEFWKKGKMDFDNEFIGGLVVESKKNAERIGEVVFQRGNVTEIRQAKKAVYEAARYNSKVNPDTVWKAMQAKYLDNFMTPMQKVDNSLGDIEYPDYRKLLRTLNDPKQRRTLSAIFDSDQLNSLKDLALIGQRLDIGGKHSSQMIGYMIQAGALAGLASADILTGDGNYTAKDAAVDITVVGMFPRVVASILTSPKSTRMMTRYLAQSRPTQETITRFSTQIGREVARDLLSQQDMWGGSNE